MYTSIGNDASVIANGDTLTQPPAALRFILNILSSSNILQLLPFNPPPPPSTSSSTTNNSNNIVSLTASNLLKILPLQTSPSSSTTNNSNNNGNNNHHVTDNNTSAAADTSLREILESLSKLTTSENDNLRSLSSDILERFSNQLITRLQKLK